MSLEENNTTPVETPQQDKSTSYLEKARNFYKTDAPNSWDVSYSYYTAEGAPPIMAEKDRTNIVNILNHGKYNRKMLRLSIILAVISVIGLIVTGMVPVFDMKVIVKVIFIVLEALLLAFGIMVFRKNRFSSLSWMIPGFCGIWIAYLIVWIL